MATRWMKWNEGTHIFEYSTDGVVFNPLPLDASILTQGTIDPARLPAGMPSGDGNNVWTGANIYSGVEPKLRFNETDQAVGSKNWEIGAVDGFLRIRGLDDSYATPVEVFSISRGGSMVITGVGTTVHRLNSNVAGPNLLDMSNPNAAAGAYTGLTFANDQGIQRTFLIQTSAAFATAGFVADGFNIASNGVGGVNISGAVIRFKTGGTDRLVINSTGATFAVPIVEATRATAMGYWVANPYVAGDFTASAGTWTVDAGDMSSFRYMIIGKTLFYSIRLLNTSTSAGMGTQLKIKVPGGFSCPTVGLGSVHFRMGSVYETGIITVQATDMILFRQDFSASFVSSIANAFDVRIEGFFEISN